MVESGYQGHSRLQEQGFRVLKLWTATLQEMHIGLLSIPNNTKLNCLNLIWTLMVLGAIASFCLLIVCYVSMIEANACSRKAQRLLSDQNASLISSDGGCLICFIMDKMHTVMCHKRFGQDLSLPHQECLQLQNAPHPFRCRDLLCSAFQHLDMGAQHLFLIS